MKQHSEAKLLTTVKPVTEEEEVNKYACDDGRIVRVEYEGGKSFILNYNNFEIKVEYDGVTYTVDALDFAVMK